MYTELTNWIILSIFALPASVYTIWHLKTDDDRVSKGFTLKDLIISVVFGLLPVMQWCMFICGCACIIFEIMTKSDKISLFKTKKRYTQDEVNELLASINRMKPYKDGELRSQSVDCLDRLMIEKIELACKKEIQKLGVYT